MASSILIRFLGATKLEHTNLPERLKDAGFIMLSDQELGEIVTKANGSIERLKKWVFKFDFIYFILTCAWCISVFVLEWALHGLTILFVVLYIIFSVIMFVIFQLVVRKIAQKRARTAFKEIFQTGRSPTIDQDKRIKSVSRWLTAVGQLKLEDGKTIVMVNVPALKSFLFVRDTYRQ